MEIQLNPNTLLIILSGLVVTLIGFNIRRERELATIQASLKAIHKRMDRQERLTNGKD